MAGRMKKRGKKETELKEQQRLRGETGEALNLREKHREN